MKTGFPVRRWCAAALGAWLAVGAIPAQAQTQIQTSPDSLAGGLQEEVARIRGSVDTEADRDQLLKHYGRLLQIGTLNNNLGRYRESEGAFTLAGQVCRRAFGAEHSACADAQVRAALELSNQGRFEEAELAFKEAESQGRGSAAPLDQPRWLSYRAMDLANRRQFEAAYAMALEANVRRQALVGVLMADGARPAGEIKAELERVLADLAHGLFVLAAMALHVDKLDEATVSAHLARKLILKSKHLPDWWVAFVDELLAGVDVRRGNLTSAEERLKLAIQTKQLALGNSRPLAMSFLSLGSLFSEERRAAEALGAMRPGLAILRAEAGSSPGVERVQLEPFLLAAHAEAEKNAAARPVLFAEMFEAGQLLRTDDTANTIVRTVARFMAANPAIAALVRQGQEAAQRRDQLRLDLGRLAVESGGANRAHLDALSKRHRAAVQEAEALEKQLVVAFPEYERLTVSRPVSPADAGRLLKPGEALVQFALGEHGSFAFVVRDNGLTVHPIALTRDQAEAAVRRLRRPLARTGGRILPFDLDEAHRLYQALMTPLETDLAGVAHVIVVPSESLMSLPFGLLVSRSPAGLAATDYGAAAWLVRSMAVSVVPTVRAFTDLRGLARPSTAPEPFIGFGDPVLKGTADGRGLEALAGHCQIGTPVPPEVISGLARLPETADELRQVARVLGAPAGSVRLGAEASERRVRAAALDRYRIVYFATHGLLPGELRCQAEPALVLSPPATPAVESGDAGRAGDGLLDASEIAGLRLDADLVVLSACNTGGGGSDRFGGGSLSGLARAFFQAGARSLIVSHWTVDTLATQRLMTALFEDMARTGDHRPAEALRHAQLSLAADAKTAHPFFWAAFTVVGAAP